MFDTDLLIMTSMPVPVTYWHIEDFHVFNPPTRLQLIRLEINLKDKNNNLVSNLYQVSCVYAGASNIQPTGRVAFDELSTLTFSITLMRWPNLFRHRPFKKKPDFRKWFVPIDIQTIWHFPAKKVG